DPLLPPGVRALKAVGAAFGDQQAAVGLHHSLDAGLGEGDGFLLGSGDAGAAGGDRECGGRESQEHEESQDGQQRWRSARSPEARAVTRRAARTADAPHRHRPDPERPGPRFSSGISRRRSSLTAKYSRGWNPICRATRLVGNVSRRVLYIMTVSL